MVRIIFWFNTWIASWVDMICGFVGVITFNLYRPWWDMKYRFWMDKKELKRMIILDNMKKTIKKLE